MNQYEIEGRVKMIAEVQTLKNGFNKREFVIETVEKYPQAIKFECVKDRCALLDGIAEGDDVRVQFRIRGSAYNDRYFVNLQAFGVERQGAANMPEEDQIQF